ncbi:hypothetical protein ACU4GR_02460 [Methylobacterium oryzae CBMB20]
MHGFIEEGTTTTPFDIVRAQPARPCTTSRRAALRAAPRLGARAARRRAGAPGGAGRPSGICSAGPATTCRRCGSGSGRIGIASPTPTAAGPRATSCNAARPRDRRAPARHGPWTAGRSSRIRSGEARQRHAGAGDGAGGNVVPAQPRHQPRDLVDLVGIVAASEPEGDGHRGRLRPARCFGLLRMAARLCRPTASAIGSVGRNRNRSISSAQTSGRSSQSARHRVDPRILGQGQARPRISGRGRWGYRHHAWAPIMGSADTGHQEGVILRVIRLPDRHVLCP